MQTVTVNTGHPEGLTLAATEMAASRLSSARNMIKRVGEGTGSADNARRKLGAAALRDAIVQLQAAEALLKAGVK